MSNKFDYILASRNGLFLIGHAGWERLYGGNFFGLTVNSGHIYCFETRQVEGPSGRILRFDRRGDGWGMPQTIIEGLDHGCHQIDFFDNALFIVDTYKQAVHEFDRQGNVVTTHRPIPPAAFNDWDGGYVHMNSIIGRGERILLMLHKGNSGPSEILELDRSFRIRDRIVLVGYRCHDLAILEDGGLLYCDSTAGILRSHRGASVKIDNLMTRGLAVGRTEIAVGSSLLAERMGRRFIPGFVTFLTRDFKRLARLEVPAAPTQIRRLDGQDFSLSQPVIG